MKKQSANQNQKKSKAVPGQEGVALDFASSIIKNTSDAVIAIKLNGEITLWNNGAVECYGYTSEEALGKNISFVYRKEDLPLLGKRIKKVIQGENISNAEVVIIDKFKNERTVLLSITGIKDEKGKVNQMVGLTKDITETKLAKQVEQKLNFQLESTLFNVSDGFVSLDTNWCYKYVNLKAAEFLGRSQEDLIGKNIWTVFPEAVGLPFYKAYYEAVESQKDIVFEEFYEPFSKWFENRIYPSSDGLTIYFTDITEEKQKTQSIINNELRFRSLFESARDGVFIVDKGRIVDVNQSTLKKFRYKDKSEIINKFVIDISPEFQPDGSLSKEGIQKFLKKAMTGEPQLFNWKHKRKDGTEFHTEVSLNQFTYNENKLILASVRDISKRVSFEKELQKRQAEILHGQNLANFGDWSWDFQNGEIKFSDVVYRIYGIELNTPLNYETVTKVIHPVDFEKHKKEIEVWVQNKKVTPYEYRVIHPDGSKRHVYGVGRIEFDEKGEPVKLFGTLQDVTIQKEVEHKLQKAKEKAEADAIYLDNIINNIGDPVFVKDDKSRLILVNDAFCVLFDLERDDIIGSNLAEDVSASEQEHFLRIDKQILKTGKESKVEESLTIRGGQSKTISTRKTRYIDSSGKKYLIGVIRDITERIYNEKKIQESKIKFEILSNATFEGILIHDNGVPVDLNNSFPNMFGYTKEEFIGEDLVQLIIHKDYQNTVYDNVKLEHKLSYEVIGVKKDGTEFPIEIEGKTYITEENKKLRVAAIRDLTERKKAEEGQIHLINIIEQSLNEIYVFNADTWLFQYVNSGAIKNIGYSIEEMANMTPLHIKPDLTEAKFRKLLAPLKSNKKTKIKFETRHLRKDKSSYPVEIHLQRIVQLDKEVYLAVILDITDRKLAEENLINSEQLFRGLTANAPVAIYQTDKEGVCNFVNEAWIEYSGLSYDESMGYGWSSAIHPEDRDRIVKEWQKSILTDDVLFSEYRLVHKNGEIAWLSSKSVALFDANNELYGFIGTLIDITERKNAEEEIKQTLSQLNLAVKTAKLGVWSRDVETDELIWNDRLFEIYGSSPDEFESNMDSYFDRLHPDDLDYINEVLGSLYEGEPQNDVKFRIITPDNEIRYIDSSAAPLMVNGRIEKYIGINRDITEQKITEENLKEAFAQLNMAVDTAKLGVWTHTIETGGLVWNEELFEIFGKESSEFDYSADAFIKQVHPDDLEYVMEQHEKVVQNKSGIGLDFRIIRPNNEVRYIYATVTPIFDEEGNLTKTIGVNLDVTERKLSEINLKEAFAQLNLAVDTAKIGVWTHTIETGELIWNSELFEIFGIAPSEFDESANSFIKLVHPEDLAYVMEKHDESGQNKSVTSLEFRIVRPSNEVRYIYATVNPVFDEEGNLIKTIGINLDVTERKTSELEIKRALNEITELKLKIEAENVYLKEELKLEGKFEEIIGSSKSLVKILKQVEQVAKTDSTVFVLGETGTGKELIAKAIHKASNRKDKPLVKVNCSALPAELIESELFGHEKGAFTGAINRKIGRFELANNGTIFLDEIGDIPIELQTRLLRVLQESEFERVGGEATIKVDVRLITATNRNLEELVIEGKFRQDLYYRLNVFPITSPPLRERLEDIPNLVNHFVLKYNHKVNNKIKSIDKKSIEKLMRYEWPGNIRELEHVIERAIILNQGEKLRLGSWFVQEGAKIRLPNKLRTLEELERHHITKVLEKTNWKIRGINGAAEILGLKPTTLESRIKKLKINKVL